MRIGVLCSGGDAPGMNACVRAVVRSATARGHEVIGIRHGYRGMIDEDFYPARGESTATAPGNVMSPRTVSDWLRYGGTFLRTSRCPEFRTEEGMRRAAEILSKHKIEGVVIIGGDGSLRGAEAFSEYYGGLLVGCPGTIDNDLLGTDYTIGFSSAVRTAVEAVDMIRDTADSHERMFLIEVMGRHSGYIAAYTALGTGAESVCIPETPTDVPAIIDYLKELKARGKSSVMMVVAEGDEAGGAATLHQQLQEAGAPYSMRVLILGHLQRGGSPTVEDRLLASRLGDEAVTGLLEGRTGMMVGVIHRELTWTRFPDTYAAHKPIPLSTIELIERLSH